MTVFVPDGVVIDAAQRKRVKYDTKCSTIGYDFLPFSFSSLEELEEDTVTLLKRIRKFSMTQDLGHVLRDGGLDVCVDLTGSSHLTQTGMTDFTPGRTVIDAAQHKHVKYEAKCATIGYGFLPFLFSSLEELEEDAVTLLKRIRTMFQDIGVRAAIHIFNMIGFVVAKVGIIVRKEALMGFFLEDGKDLQPADLLLFNWLQGKDACLDVTDIFPFAGMGMALWKSQMEDHTSVWLRAVRISGLGQTMNACFRVFAGDIYGDHVVSYTGIIGIKHRHNVMRDTLVDICYRSGFQLRGGNPWLLAWCQAMAPKWPTAHDNNGSRQGLRAVAKQKPGVRVDGPKRRRTYIFREREEAEQRLIDDYFGDDEYEPKYPEEKFRRSTLGMKILEKYKSVQEAVRKDMNGHSVVLTDEEFEVNFRDMFVNPAPNIVRDWVERCDLYVRKTKELRDRKTHNELRKDLVEHLWNNDDE
ncbi:hypothetical protein Tco_0781534 [Tanacetum coccineum]